MSNLIDGRGAPDTDFGVRSEVVLYGEQGQRLQARVVTLLSNPNRILCGATDEARQETYLSMLDEEGRIDKSFGNSGSVVFKLSEFFPGWDLAQPYSVKFDSVHSKYVLGFFARKDGFNRATGLARFDLNGEFDEGFGSNGIMLWFPDLKEVVPASSDVPKVKQLLADKGRDYHGTMELLDDGGVLLLTTLDYRGSFDRAYVVKLKNNGSLDVVFGNRGYVLVFRGSSASVIGQDMFRQGVGYVVAASEGLRDKSWFVGRYDARGDLDSSFGVEGYYDGVPSVKNVILKRDDRSQFYIVGTSDNGVPQYLYLQLQRRGLEGEEDPLFGKQGWGGYIKDYFSDIYITKAALYNLKSTAVVAGYAYLSGGSDSQAFIASLEQDMGWDEGFGDGGKIVFPEKDQIIHDLAVQEDRKIVFVSSKNRERGSFAIFRLHG